MAATPERLSVRERNKLRMRDDLLEALLDLYAEGDFPACTVENIAQHAGCAKATVYAYFPGGRDEMLCALYERFSLEVSVEGIRQRDRAATTHDRIMALAKSLLEMASRPRAGKFFALLNPALSPVLQPVLGRSSQHVAKLIAEDLSSHTFATQKSKSDIDTLAVLIVGTFREASVKVAENTTKKAEMLNGISTLIESLLQ